MSGQWRRRRRKRRARLIFHLARAPVAAPVDCGTVISAAIALLVLVDDPVAANCGDAVSEALVVPNLSIIRGDAARGPGIRECVHVLKLLSHDERTRYVRACCVTVVAHAELVADLVRQDESSCAGLVRFGHHHNSSGSMRMAAPNDAVLPGGALIYREARGHSSRNDHPTVFCVVSTDAVCVGSTYETSVQVTTREQIRDVVEWKILQVFVSPHPKRVQQD